MSQNSRNVTRIEAKPEPMNIELSKTAVLVVDMQNDFGSKGGMFDRAGLDISMIQSAVRPTSKRPDLFNLGGSASPNWTETVPQ